VRRQSFVHVGSDVKGNSKKFPAEGRANLCKPLEKGNKRSSQERGNCSTKAGWTPHWGKGEKYSYWVEETGKKQGAETGR